VDALEWKEEYGIAGHRFVFLLILASIFFICKCRIMNSLIRSPPSPAPLSSHNAYTTWPGGVDPTAPLFNTDNQFKMGGRRRSTTRRRSTRRRRNTMRRRYRK